MKHKTAWIIGAQIILTLMLLLNVFFTVIAWEIAVYAALAGVFAAISAAAWVFRTRRTLAAVLTAVKIFPVIAVVGFIAVLNLYTAAPAAVAAHSVSAVVVYTLALPLICLETSDGAGESRFRLPFQMNQIVIFMALLIMEVVLVAICGIRNLFANIMTVLLLPALVQLMIVGTAQYALRLNKRAQKVLAAVKYSATYFTASLTIGLFVFYNAGTPLLSLQILGCVCVALIPMPFTAAEMRLISKTAKER